MHVAAQSIGVLADDHGALRVRLQTHESVHDVHTRAFEGFGPCDVHGFVESRLQLDQHGDLHTTFGSPDEVSRDRAVATRAVQGHLDALHSGIVSGLRQELFDRTRETLVGMVDEERSLTNHRKDRPLVGLGGGEATGRDRNPRIVLQIGSIDGVYLPQTSQIERPAHPRDVVAMQFEFVEQQVDHGGRRTLFDFEAYGPTETAATQLGFDCSQQIVGIFVLERQVGVASDAKGDRVGDFHTGEQRTDVRLDDHVDGNEAFATGQREQARKHRWHFHAGEALVAGLRIAHHHCETESQIRHVRERVSRVDRERCENREDSLVVVIARDSLLGFGEIGPCTDRDAVRTEGRLDVFEEDRLLTGRQLSHTQHHTVELTRWRESVGQRNRHTRRLLIAHGGHPDLEELVEVGREDGEELGPLEQRHTRFGGHAQNALVEVEPAQFAVDEAIR